MISKPPESTLLRIAVAHEHFVMREGLRLILEGQPGFELIGVAADSAAIMRLVEERQPHVVLMDVHLDGLEAIEHIRCCWPQVAVVILAMHDNDEWMLQGLHAGATGYLLKNIDHTTLFRTIRAAARGETLLQPEIMARLLAYTTPALVRRKNNLRGKKRYVEMVELTEREHDVLVGVARGERNKEIAARLGISETTVKTHLMSIYHKLEVDSRASAVVVAIERGLFSPPKKAPDH